MTRKRFKLGCIFSLICAFVLFVINSVVFLIFTDKAEFVNYMSTIMKVVDEVYLMLGISFEEMLTEANMEMGEFYTVIYIIYYVILTLGILSSIGLAILGFMNLKDIDLNQEEFQKQNKKHVLFVVAIGLVFLLSELSPAFSYSSLSFLGTAIFVLSIIAFILTLKDIKANKLYNTIINQQVNDYKFEPNYTKEVIDETKKEENVVNEATVVDEKEETKETEAKVDLTEAYELLAKLEHQYKNNEITKEDYERMKKTIIDNFLNR